MICNDQISGNLPFLLKTFLIWPQMGKYILKLILPEKLWKHGFMSLSAFLSGHLCSLNLNIVLNDESTAH